MESLGALLQPHRIVLTTISKIFQGFSWFCRFLRYIWRITLSPSLSIPIFFFFYLWFFVRAGCTRTKKTSKWSLFVSTEKEIIKIYSVKQWIEKVLIFLYQKILPYKLPTYDFSFVGKLIQNGMNLLYFYGILLVGY